jgi:hypothetical protein
MGRSQLKGSAIDLIDRIVRHSKQPHVRPAPKPDIIEALLTRGAIQRHHAATARRFAKLHHEASILRKSVTAAYDVVGHGTGEMSDRRAEEHARLTAMYRAAGMVGSRIVERVVVDETMVEVSVPGLIAALDRMGDA